LECEPRVQSRWIEVTYRKPGRFLDRIPRLPAGLRGTLAGRQEVIDGLKGTRPDVLFFNTQVPAAILGPGLFRYTYVLSTDITPLQYDRMADFYRHSPDRSPLLAAAKRRFNQAVFQRAALLFPWSAWTARSLVEDYGVDPQKIEVIPPGIDLDLWKPASDRQPEGKTRAGMQPASPARILFVGADLERKGGLDLIAAFQALPPGIAELVLVTRSLVAEMPGVQVVSNLEPNSPALVQLYQSSDIFVLPTRAEAFGIAAVEASAAGLPVIASPVGGLTDIVDHEQTGFLVPPGSRAELASALQSLINSPELRISFGRAARRKAEQVFDIQKCSQRIIEKIFQIEQES
jgi:glycosyltransferase involved in cell wall biosynthesis